MSNLCSLVPTESIYYSSGSSQILSCLCCCHKWQSASWKSS